MSELAKRALAEFLQRLRGGITLAETMARRSQCATTDSRSAARAE
jgi:hypothetical protein